MSCALQGILALFCSVAAAGSPAALEKLNKSLNPTPTPNLYGTESHISGVGVDVDPQGNRIVIKKQTPDDRRDPRPVVRATPVAAFLPLWQELRDFDAGLDSALKSGAISKAKAQQARKQLALLKLKYRLDQAPDGSRLSPGQLKGLRTDLHALK